MSIPAAPGRCRFHTSACPVDSQGEPLLYCSGRQPPFPDTHPPTTPERQDRPQVAQASHPFASRANPIRDFFEGSGALALLFYRTLGAVLRGRILLGETIRQMKAIGYDSIQIN